MTTKSNPSEPVSDKNNSLSAVAGGAGATSKTATDTWVTGQSKADPTDLRTLPKAVANAIDGKDHSNDKVLPDQGGRVFDTIAADANRKAAELRDSSPKD